MIGRIEARSFKHDPHGKIDLAQGMLPALRAFFQDRIIKMLLTIELHAAVFAAVGINGHKGHSKPPVIIVSGYTCIKGGDVRVVLAFR